jgi:hypothetical protein
MHSKFKQFVYARVSDPVQHLQERDGDLASQAPTHLVMSQWPPVASLTVNASAHCAELGG